MARILIISEEWPHPAPGAALLPGTIRGAGHEVAVMTSERSQQESPVEKHVIRAAFEAPKESGRLFRLRNALFFDTAANPGNYASLREALHFHLQEVLYDAVLILCPPSIYLKLAYWIDLSFGIPVWLHVSAPLSSTMPGAFHRWNHARLRRKYLGAAVLMTAGDAALFNTVTLQEYQMMMLVIPQSDGMRLIDPATADEHSINDVLQMLIHRKPQQ